MMKIFAEKLFKTCIVLVPLLIVFAQERLRLFGIPWYVPEVLALGALGGLLLFERDYSCFLPKRSILFWSLVLLAIGLLSATLATESTLHGHGRLKSWFFFPLLYGTMLSFSLRRGLITRDSILRGMFFGGLLVGFFMVGEIFQGGAFSYDNRLRGTFLSPNQLALLLGPTLLAGIFLAGAVWQRLGWEKWGIVFGSLFLSILLLLTQSYAVIFTMLLLLGVGLMMYRERLSRTMKMSVTLSIIICVGIVFLFSSKWQGMMHFDERSSIASRAMIWRSALLMIEDHPFVGIGPGNFQGEYTFYQRYFPPYLEWSAPHPHNMFLDIWLEGGLLGIVGFVAFFWYWAASSVRYFWQKKNESAVRALPLVFVLYFFLVGLVDVPFLRNDLAYFFAAAFVISAYEFTALSDRSCHRAD